MPSSFLPDITKSLNTSSQVSSTHKMALPTKFSEEIRRQAANQKIGLAARPHLAPEIPSGVPGSKSASPKKPLTYFLNGIRGVESTAKHPKISPLISNSLPLSKYDYFSALDAWEKTNVGAARGPASTAIRIIKKWVERGRPEEPLLLNGLGLKKLPESLLPRDVRRLILNGNHLTHLPLPPHIVELHANNNRLSYLPKEVTRFPAYTIIHLRNNPFSLAVKVAIRKITTEHNYSGPRFIFGDLEDLA